MAYDWIIVGAGAAGSVVAARLSEDPGVKVLLIEAGPDLPEMADRPQPLRDAHQAVLRGYNWPFRARLREDGMFNRLSSAGAVFQNTGVKSKFGASRAVLSSKSALASFDYPVGRIVGGSSSINGCLAMPPDQRDLSRWVTTADSPWAWNQVSASLDNVLRHSGFSIETRQQSELTVAQASFVDAVRSIGYPMIDMAGPADCGVGILPRTVSGGQRVSAADAFLSEARTRSNLTIMTETLVDKVLMSGRSAMGVRIHRQADVIDLHSDRVVLCAGAVNTPCVLMRSGIGDADWLEAAGIEPLIDRPGVGKNFIDHTSVGLWCVPEEGICQPNEDAHQVMWRKSIAGSKQPTDVQIYMVSSVDTRQFPELKAALACDLAMSLTVVLCTPESTGSVRTTAADPAVPPEIVLNCASTSADMSRLRSGVRDAWSIMQHPSLQRCINRPFAWSDRIVNDDKLLTHAITTFARGSWHGCGTARMGQISDRNAVVDDIGAVHDCKGLLIADAAIMPNIPSVPTNITCMMIGEHCARLWS